MSAERYWNSFWESLRLLEKQRQKSKHYFRAGFVVDVAVAEFGNVMAESSGRRGSESVVSPPVLAFECDVLSAVFGHHYENNWDFPQLYFSCAVEGVVVGDYADAY